MRLFLLPSYQWQPGERFHRRSAVCHSSKVVRVIEIVCVKRSGSGMVSLLNSLSFRINHLTYQNPTLSDIRNTVVQVLGKVWVRLSQSPAPDLAALTKCGGPRTATSRERSSANRGNTSKAVEEESWKPLAIPVRRRIT